MQFPVARKRRACLHILSSRRPIKVESSPAKFLGHLIFEFAIRPQRLAVRALCVIAPAWPFGFVFDDNNPG
jgi:hypothetical protein